MKIKKLLLPAVKVPLDFQITMSDLEYLHLVNAIITGAGLCYDGGYKESAEVLRDFRDLLAIAKT